MLLKMARTELISSLYLNYPDLAEMRRMYLALYSLCRIMVNLICVEEGIDSSKEAGKLLISIIAAVAELERENIRVQTMAGREQKAREARKKG